jgi:hypothetical protein
MTFFKPILVLPLLCLCGSVHAGWFGPKNYDECILENMKGVTLRQAVWAIQNSCRAKFPEACYAWQKEHPKQRKNLFDNLDAKYAQKTDPALLSSYGDAAPDGCYAVLR